MLDPSANHPAFESPRRPHVESWFLKLTEPTGARALWLRWTVLVAPPQPARAEWWLVAFQRGRPPRAFKRSTELGSVMIQRAPFAFELLGTRFDGTSTSGEIESASGMSASWDLALE